MRWFDGHLDLAYLVELGRDMHAGIDACRGRLLPAAVTLPSLADGGVRACLGTIFTERASDGFMPDPRREPYAYAPDDAPGAWRVGMRQLRLYQAWAEAGSIRLLSKRGGQDDSTPTSHSRLCLGILMEGADPIEAPDQLSDWVDSGVIAIGLSWWRGSRYAAGNGGAGGLTSLGRELVSRMDALGIVHDLTHLSQQATDELLTLSNKPVVASHSNARSLLGGRHNPDWQRHIADETIAEIGRRGGMVGINLVRNFLRFPLGASDRPGIDELVAHIEHVASVMGHRRGVGLGSDMDGGITAADLPRGIGSPSDLPRIAEALNDRGWSDAEIEAFAWANWARFWGISARENGS
ncbi:MAG: membrane dipeptidase [Phycisphaeraceae bacterium]|nr:membrane dipeptidase [Phycisphaeraceae bacterium]